MSTRAEFWSAVDAELDAHRDPFASAAVRSWTFEQAEDATELVELCASLELLSRTPVPLQKRRTWRIAALAPLAAAVLLCAFVAYSAARMFARAAPTSTATIELERHPIRPAPTLGSVQSWELVATLQTVRGTQTVREREGERSIETDFTDALAQVMISERHEESWSAR